MTNADAAIGLRIKEVRKARGISLIKLAEAVTVSVQQMQKYENGQNRVTAANLVSLAKILQVDVRALIGVDDGARTWSVHSPRAEALARLFDQIEDVDVQSAIYTLAKKAAASVRETDQEGVG